MAVGVNVALIGEWKRALSITGNLAQRYRRAQQQAVAQEANFLAGKVVEGFADIGPPLAASTLAVRKRGGSKPLNATGGLRRSIKAHKVDDDTWFVGVLKSATHPSGEALYNVAAVHEFGATIVMEITEAAHKFLMAKFKRGGRGDRDKRGRFKRTSIIRSGGGTGIAVIKIPPRPFLRPAFDRYARPSQVKARFNARMSALFSVLGR